MKQNTSSSIANYHDTQGGFTPKELTYASWLARHRIQIVRRSVQLLGLVAGIFFLSALWGWGSYLAVGMFADADMITRQLTEFPNYEAMHIAYGPQAISISRTDIFRSGVGVYDVVGMATNNNEQWLAVVTIEVTLPDGASQQDEVVILPGSEVPLGIYGLRSDKYPTGVQLQILSTDWQRFDLHKTPNIASFIAERISVTADDLLIRPAGAGLAAPQISFTLKNNSSYSYWQADLIVLLSGPQGSRYVPISKDRFIAGQSSNITVSLFGDAPTITNIRVFPIINVLDEQVYLAPGQ